MASSEEVITINLCGKIFEPDPKNNFSEALLTP